MSENDGHLCLTRKVNESVCIGNDVEIQVIETRADRVRLRIMAPRSVAVHRKEVYRRIQDESPAKTDRSLCTLYLKDQQRDLLNDLQLTEARPIEELICRAVALYLSSHDSGGGLQ